jgi:hypothetical protein
MVRKVVYTYRADTSVALALRALAPSLKERNRMVTATSMERGRICLFVVGVVVALVRFVLQVLQVTTLSPHMLLLFLLSSFPLSELWRFGGVCACVFLCACVCMQWRKWSKRRDKISTLLPWPCAAKCSKFKRDNRDNGIENSKKQHLREKR